MEKIKQKQKTITEEFEIFVKDIVPSEIYDISSTIKGQDIAYYILDLKFVSSL